MLMGAKRTTAYFEKRVRVRTFILSSSWAISKGGDHGESINRTEYRRSWKEEKNTSAWMIQRKGNG